MSKGQKPPKCLGYELFSSLGGTQDVSLFGHLQDTGTDFRG